MGAPASPEKRGLTSGKESCSIIRDRYGPLATVSQTVGVLAIKNQGDGYPVGGSSPSRFLSPGRRRHLGGLPF